MEKEFSHLYGLSCLIAKPRIYCILWIVFQDIERDVVVLSIGPSGEVNMSFLVIGCQLPQDPVYKGDPRQATRQSFH